jgi:hypothetical protein
MDRPVQPEADAQSCSSLASTDASGDQVDVTLVPRLKEYDNGMNALRSAVMVSHQHVSMIVTRIHMTKDKEKVFHSAHHFVKMVVFDLLLKDDDRRQCSFTPGIEWPLLMSDIEQVPEHHRPTLVRALQEMVISYDMMSGARRVTLVAVAEVISNVHWLIAVARFCLHGTETPQYPRLTATPVPMPSSDLLVDDFRSKRSSSVPIH